MDITLDYLAQNGVDTSSFDASKLQRLNDFIRTQQTINNPKQGILDNIGSGFSSGVGQGIASAGALTGNYDLVSSGLGKSQKAINELSPELQKQLATISDPDSFTKTLLNLAENPQAAAVLTAQSLPSSIVGGAAALVGGKGVGAIGKAGLRTATEMGIFGANSAFNEAGAQILQTLSENGVDVTDESQLKTIFEDPVIYGALVADGLKKGIPVGAFDALSYHFAGRHVKNQGLGLTTGLKETAEQAALGMAGEATGQLALEGEITNRGDIALEGALEAVTGVPQAIIQPSLKSGLDRLFPTKGDMPRGSTLPQTPVDQEDIEIGKFIEDTSEVNPLFQTTPGVSTTTEDPLRKIVPDKAIEKEAKDSVKPQSTLNIPSEILRGTHKQMKSRLMSLPIQELNKRATVNAGLDPTSLVNEKGIKLKKSALADRILSHYGVVSNETNPNAVQVAVDPSSKLKSKVMEENVPTPTGNTLDQLIELATNSKDANVKSMAVEWVKSIQNRKAKGTITLPESDSKKVDKATKTLTNPTKTPKGKIGTPFEDFLVEQGIQDEVNAEAINNLSKLQGKGNKRFNDALAALLSQPPTPTTDTTAAEPPTQPPTLTPITRVPAQEQEVPVVVNPVLQQEALQETSNKAEAIQVTKKLKSSPTLIKGMNSFDAMQGYRVTGDIRYLTHIVQTLLNSKFLGEQDKAALKTRYPEMGRYLMKELGIESVNDEGIAALKDSPKLEVYLISSLLDKYLKNPDMDLKDFPRIKTSLNKIKGLIEKNYGKYTPEKITQANAPAIVSANTETVKEASAWKTIDSYQKLSSDLGVYLDKEPKLVLSPEAFKNAADVTTLGKISRSMDTFRSMPSLARKYEFFQPLMDMYMQRDNFRHTILQTHMKAAERLVKKYGEARNQKALEVLDIMSRPNQKDNSIQKIEPTESGNIRYRDIDGKLKEVDATTSKAVLEWQDVFKQNLAIIAQTVKTDMHQFGLDPTSNNRTEVLDLINEYKATNMNREADRLQNALNLLDILDEMFSKNEAYFPHTRSRGPYAMAAYSYGVKEDGSLEKKPTLVGFYSVKAKYNGSIDKEDLALVKARIQKDQETHGSPFVTAEGNNIDMAQPFYKTTNTLKSILMKNATNTSLAYEAVASLLSQKGIDPKTVNEMFDELKLNNNIEKLFTNLRRKKGYYGYDNDDHLNIAINHLIGQSSLITSYRYRPRIDAAFSKIGLKLGQQGPTGKEVLNRLTRYQEYMTNPEEEWTWIRSLNYWYFLAGNPSTMALQVLSTHLFTVPWVAQFTGFGTDFIRANYKVFTNYKPIVKTMGFSEGYKESNPVKMAKEVGIPVEDAKILINLKKEGMLDPGYAIEAVGDTDLRGNTSKYPRVKKAIESVAVKPMQATENVGRMNTAFLLLDLLKRGDNMEKIGTLLYNTDNGFRVRVDNQYGGVITKEAIIRQAIDENHAIFGKRGRAPYMRGPVGATLFAFQTYPQQMLENMARLAFDRGNPGRKAFLMAMFAYPILFGGLMAVPMYDTWDWLMKVFAKEAQKRNTNLNIELSRALNEMGFESDNFKGFLMKVNNTLGYTDPEDQITPNKVKRAILHGPLLQGLGGVDVSQRIGLQAWFQPFLNAFFDPTAGFGSAASDKLIGGFSTIETNMKQAKAQIQEGDDAIESYTKAFLPTAVKNIVKAKDILDGDIESSKGINVLTPQELGPELAGKPITKNQLMKMAVQRALGANPDILSQANELKYQNSVTNSEYTGEYTSFNKKISQKLQDSILARKRGDKELALESQKELANIIKDLVEFNKSTRDPKDPEKLMKDMQKAVRMDLYKNMFPLMVKDKDRPAKEVVDELSLPAMEGRAMNKIKLP